MKLTENQYRVLQVVKAHNPIAHGAFNHRDRQVLRSLAVKRLVVDVTNGENPALPKWAISIDGSQAITDEWMHKNPPAVNEQTEYERALEKLKYLNAYGVMSDFDKALLVVIAEQADELETLRESVRRLEEKWKDS